MFGHHLISEPTYCLSSCSSVVRPLVYQHRGPGSIPGVFVQSQILQRGKPINCCQCSQFVMEHVLTIRAGAVILIVSRSSAKAPVFTRRRAARHVRSVAVLPSPTILAVAPGG